MFYDLCCWIFHLEVEFVYCFCCCCESIKFNLILKHFDSFYYGCMLMWLRWCAFGWWIWLSISNILRSVYIWPNINTKPWFCLPISIFFYCIFMFEYNFAIKNENHCRKTSIAYNPFGIYFAQTATNSSRLQYTTAWNTQWFLSGLIWKTHRAKCVLFSLSLALCVWQWMEQKRKETTNSMQKNQAFAVIRFRSVWHLSACGIFSSANYSIFSFLSIHFQRIACMQNTRRT